MILTGMTYPLRGTTSANESDTLKSAAFPVWRPAGAVRDNRGVVDSGHLDGRVAEAPSSSNGSPRQPDRVQVSLAKRRRRNVDRIPADNGLAVNHSIVVPLPAAFDFPVGGPACEADEPCRQIGLESEGATNNRACNYRSLP